MDEILRATQKINEASRRGFRAKRLLGGPKLGAALQARELRYFPPADGIHRGYFCGIPYEIHKGLDDIVLDLDLHDETEPADSSPSPGCLVKFVSADGLTTTVWMHRSHLRPCLTRRIRQGTRFGIEHEMTPLDTLIERHYEFQKTETVDGEPCHVYREIVL